MGGSGWKLYLVCELESGSGQLFEFNQKKQAQGGLSYLRTRKLHGTRQSRPHPSSRVSRTWEEVLTLSNQVPPYSTFLIDKGRAPAQRCTSSGPLAWHVFRPGVRQVFLLGRNLKTGPPCCENLPVSPPPCEVFATYPWMYLISEP